MTFSKPIFIVLIFYFLAILQNSFFAHFDFYGAIPNLVFIFFFLLMFFSKNRGYFQVIFYAMVAGLFLDFFSYAYFGISIVLLLLLGFFIKKTKTLLQEKRGNQFPFVYFLPLFIISFLIYSVILRIFLGLIKIAPNFDASFFAEIGYNLLVASAAFFVYKKFFQLNLDDHQLKLFK